MDMRIRTKWGQIIINPELIIELVVTIKPYDNQYRIDFVMQSNDYNGIFADLPNLDELNTTLRRLTREIEFVKQFKRKNQYGQFEVDERRRMKAIQTIDAQRAAKEDGPE